MPFLPYSIELHDSVLASIRAEDGAIAITLVPAYLHRDGKGWHQRAELVVLSGAVESNPSELPARICDGTLSTCRGPYHNLLMLPLQDAGPVKLALELDCGIFRVKGASIEVRLHGEPVFVEDVA